jgi:hypothetical protein
MLEAGYWTLKIESRGAAERPRVFALEGAGRGLRGRPELHFDHGRGEMKQNKRCECVTIERIFGDSFQSVKGNSYNGM